MMKIASRVIITQLAGWRSYSKERSSLFVQFRDCLCPVYFRNCERDFIARLQCIEQQAVLRLELSYRTATPTMPLCVC